MKRARSPNSEYERDDKDKAPKLPRSMLTVLNWQDGKDAPAPIILSRSDKRDFNSVMFSRLSVVAQPGVLRVTSKKTVQGSSLIMFTTSHPNTPTPMCA